MGLCKCPHKKVTTLFCFEHRVNVCEYCLISDHGKCVVQSYLQWLQDSDYNPNCTFCSQHLADDSREVVRLTCLHLFHLDCFNQWACQHPANTAPAGYRCPQCREPVFPRENHVSPIADCLKTQLGQSNWARSGLGLPLLPDNAMPVSSFQHYSVPPADQNVAYSAIVDVGAGMDPENSGAAPRKFVSGTAAAEPAAHWLESSLAGAGGMQVGNGVSNNENDKDTQENKYKRRSAMEWFRRWINSRRSLAPAKVDPLSTHKRVLLLLIIVLITAMTVITFLTSVGRSAADNDPLLDPAANPNLRVAQLSEN